MISRLFLGASALSLVIAAPAAAAIQFNLQDARFVDNTNLTGSITVSDDLSTLMDFNISVEANTSVYGTFDAITYTKDNAAITSWNTAQGLWALFSNPFGQLEIYVTAPLTVDGATLAHTTSDTQTYGSRHLASGELSVLADSPAVPEPATWMMLIAGFGLVGLARRRAAKGKAVTA